MRYAKNGRSTVYPRSFRPIRGNSCVAAARVVPELPATLSDAERERILAAREMRQRGSLDPVTVRSLQKDNLLRYV